MDFPPWPIPEWSWIIPTHSSEGLFCSPGPTRCWGNAPGCVFLMSVLGRVLSGRRQAAAPGFQGGWQAAGRQRSGRIDGSCWTPRSSPHPSSSSHRSPQPPAPIIHSKTILPEGSPLTPESSSFWKLVPVATPPMWVWGPLPKFTS